MTSKKRRKFSLGNFAADEAVEGVSDDETEVEAGFHQHEKRLKTHEEIYGPSRNALPNIIERLEEKYQRDMEDMRGNRARARGGRDDDDDDDDDDAYYDNHNDIDSRYDDNNSNHHNSNSNRSQHNNNRARSQQPQRQQQRQPPNRGGGRDNRGGHRGRNELLNAGDDGQMTGYRKKKKSTGQGVLAANGSRYLDKYAKHGSRGREMQADDRRAVSVDKESRKRARRHDQQMTRPSRSMPMYAPDLTTQILPLVSDHLWLVGCTLGRERSAVMQLMQKYFKYRDTRKKLYIKTCFTTDMNIGYIYVEASKEVHVRTAVADIRGLYAWKIRLVPQNELVNCLTIKNNGPQVKEGQWCRMSQGRYKGDLGQVMRVLDQGSKVVVRLVPRIDYGLLNQAKTALEQKEKKKKKKKNSRHGGRGDSDDDNAGGAAAAGDEEPKRPRYNSFRRQGTKPPKKMFNVNYMRELGEPVYAEEYDKYFQCKRVRKWRGRRFRRGYILQMVPVSKVNFDITAEAEEVSLLRQRMPGHGSKSKNNNRNKHGGGGNSSSSSGESHGDDDSDDEMFMKVPPPILKQLCQFVRGDTVKVIKGSMINLVGHVTTTKPNRQTNRTTVTIQPHHRLLSEPIMFPADELQKHFTVGVHVKVISGQYKDETGLIVKVNHELNDCILYSDLTTREITVSINQIMETSEVSTGRDILGNYALYEMVSLSRDAVGIIISIQSGQFSILDNKGQTAQYRLADITRATHDRRAVALDINNTEIRINDIVIPHLGVYKNQRATVKHIYRAVLFCHSKVCSDNNGMFVIRSRLCRLAGGTGGQRQRSQQNAGNLMNVRGSSMGGGTLHNNGGGSGHGSGHGGGRGGGGDDGGGGDGASSKNSDNTQRLRNLHRHKTKRDPWMHKTVKVIRGAWKGNFGIVKSCTDQKLRIELLAKMKNIELNRDWVRVTNNDGSEVTRDNYGQAQSDFRRPSASIRSNNAYSNSSSNRYNNFNQYGSGGGNRGGPRNGGYEGAQTPSFIGAQTPAQVSSSSASDAFNNNSNNYGGGGRTPGMAVSTPAYLSSNQTPAIGGQTPGYGGMTPAHVNAGGSDAWNVGAATPAHAMPLTPAREENGLSNNSNNNDDDGATHGMHRGQQQSPQRDYSSAQARNSNGGSNRSRYNNSNNGSNSGSSRHSLSASDYTSPMLDMSGSAATGLMLSPATHRLHMNQHSHHHGGSNNETTSNLSDSQSASESSALEKAVMNNPFYFVCRKAILLYKNAKCLVLNVNRHENTAEIRMLDNSDTSATKTVPISELKISDPTAESRVLVVSGPNAGCEGTLIGIDNDEAIVQIAHNAEVTIIQKSLVVSTM